MSNIKFYVVVLIALIVLTFFYPGVYRYDTVISGGDSIPIRTNRFTGRTEIFALTKWVSTEETKKLPFEFPDSELSKITGNMSLNSGILEGKIYNGSKNQITSIEIEVTTEDYISVAHLKDGKISTFLLKTTPEFRTMPENDQERFVKGVVVEENAKQFFTSELIENYFPSIASMSLEQKVMFHKNFIEAVAKDDIIPFLKQNDMKVKQQGWTRRFFISKTIHPLTVENFSITACDNNLKPLSFAWKFVGAKGYSEKDLN